MFSEEKKDLYKNHTRPVEIYVPSQFKAKAKGVDITVEKCAIYG